MLKLNEADHTIELKKEGVKIDLGAIGKGYALDKMAELLVQWSIDIALISAGGSTIVPIGTPAGMKGWPVAINRPGSKGIKEKILLAGCALSASGLQKGPHIIDPRNDRPAKGKIAAWTTAKTGARADAISTAFMVMPLEKIRAFCAAHRDTSAFVILPGKKRRSRNRILSFGTWNKLIF
jgi:thiamine biosynthesis lipoprotein